MPYKIEPCVYKIVNLTNGNKYVGSALRVKHRWNDHTKLLDENRHHSQRLQHAWNKYGKENFQFSIIEYCDREVMLIREQHWIDALGAFGKRGYNMNPVAWSRLGAKMSEESLKRMSEARKGTVLTEEHKKKLSIGMIGKQYSLGYKHTDETCQKRANASKEVWANIDDTARALRIVIAALARKKNATGFPGVRKVKNTTTRYNARITVNKVTTNLGTFDSPEEAYECRMRILLEMKENLESLLVANPPC